LIQTTIRYLLPAMLNTMRPSLRILALPMSRLIAAGDDQSALSTCRYQAKTGSRASSYSGWLSTKRLIVRKAITRMGHYSPKLGLAQAFTPTEVDPQRRYRPLPTPAIRA